MTRIRWILASADDEMSEEISASNRNADIHQPENPQKKRNDRTTWAHFKYFDEIYNWKQ
jgi:hypothetical protein